MPVGGRDFLGQNYYGWMDPLEVFTIETMFGKVNPWSIRVKKLCMPHSKYYIKGDLEPFIFTYYLLGTFIFLDLLAGI